MNKIKFINRIGKTLRDHRVKPADFFALSLIAELCAAHNCIKDAIAETDKHVAALIQHSAHGYATTTSSEH